MTRRLAVVGSGVAGLTAAYVASSTPDVQVTLYETDDRLGGHADTHQVGDLAIDTGFIVHNERTYPTLLRIFAELGVATQDAEMSMSTRDDETGLEWAGALGLAGRFHTAGNLRRPAYLRMLVEIPRFHRAARRLLAASGDDRTLREFLAEHGFTAYFARHFMEPVVAAVWSCDPAVALDYPARYLFTFLDHHGMLGVFGSPRWRTVTGGSREYVDRVAAAVRAAGGEVRLGTKVTSVLETPDGVEVVDGNGVATRYDAVVVAAHPDQALSLLAEPSDVQREVLGALPYSQNPALLHTDVSVLPRAERARASWNYRRVGDDRGRVTVTYDLTRLMRLPTDNHYLVTLGGEDLVDPATVIARREYAHPLYTPASVAAQARLPECDTDRIAFAGAYHGWGFHEDGARSGLAAAARLGFEWRDTGAAVSRLASSHLNHRSGVQGRDTTPGVYRTTITHTRRAPFARTFTHRSRTWLVDVDDLPRHPLARFEARDHLGSPQATIRANVTSYLARHGVPAPSRILLAAHPRVLGSCFNPISVFWCFGPDGEPSATVVEVHNTYGDRHAYLVHPDAQGRARTEKAMYVSPFHGVDGHYELAVPVPGDRLDVAVTLHTDDGARFSASLRGVRDRGRLAVWRAAPEGIRGALLIRIHGVWLWARGRRDGLRVRPRPVHHQEGVS
jgi:predicted NAD/FAD-binding protein/DUF1365 family protein